MVLGLQKRQREIRGGSPRVNDWNARPARNGRRRGSYKGFHRDAVRDVLRSAGDI